MRSLAATALLACTIAVSACSSPSADITTAANEVTQLVDTAGRRPLTGTEVKSLRDDLQTLVAQQAGDQALVAAGALKTSGQQAAGALSAALRSLSDARQRRGAHAAVCAEAFGVDLLPGAGPAPTGDAVVRALVARALQLRGGGQAPEAYLTALTDALCRAPSR